MQASSIVTIRNQQQSSLIVTSMFFFSYFAILAHLLHIALSKTLKGETQSINFWSNHYNRRGHPIHSQHMMMEQRRTTKAPRKSPTLNVIQGLWCSPKGGTLSRFMARPRFPPSSSWITSDSVSEIILLISRLVWKCDGSTRSMRHRAPASVFRSYISVMKRPFN